MRIPRLRVEYMQEEIYYIYIYIHMLNATIYSLGYNRPEER